MMRATVVTRKKKEGARPISLIPRAKGRRGKNGPETSDGASTGALDKTT